MIKLIVLKKEGNIYYVKDNMNNTYKFHLVIYDIDEIIKDGDIIYINSKLLKSITNNAVKFGKIESIYGKDITSELDDDIMILQTQNKRYILKRLYG